MIIPFVNSSLARGKHHAAMETFEMIPSDARESIMAQWQDQVHIHLYILRMLCILYSCSQEIPHEVSNGIQEHLCISAYLVSIE